MKLDKNDEETRHPTHRRYRWWSGMLTWGGGGVAWHDAWMHYCLKLEVPIGP